MWEEEAPHYITRLHLEYIGAKRQNAIFHSALLQYD